MYIEYKIPALYCTEPQGKGKAGGIIRIPRTSIITHYDIGIEHPAADYTTWQSWSPACITLYGVLGLPRIYTREVKYSMYLYLAHAHRQS